MGNFDALKEWEIPISDSFGKYELGKSSDDFNDIKDLKPIFSFDYISLDKNEFGFMGTLLGSKDYKNLLKSLKDISKHTYGQLSKEHCFHFHEIDWNDVSVQSSAFYKCIYGEFYNGTETDITPYQFKSYQEARVIGFLYKGVFYLVMFDRGHNAYKRKDKKKR